MHNVIMTHAAPTAGQAVTGHAISKVWLGFTCSAAIYHCCLLADILVATHGQLQRGLAKDGGRHLALLSAPVI